MEEAPAQSAQVLSIDLALVLLEAVLLCDLQLNGQTCT
jgi:hypothetical protein